MKTKSKLRILSLAEWDYAGVGYQLSRAINDTTDNHSDSIRWHTSYIKYPYQLLQPDSKMIAKLWKQADVIHIHDAFNHLPKGLQAKPTVVTYHGSMYRRSPQRYDRMCAKSYWIQTVSTLDLTLLGDGLWMPDTRFCYVPGLDQAISPGEFTVCHAPTSRLAKSSDLVIEACKTADVKLELIENEVWKDCLDRKSKCHILVDQFDLGYGCNAIEAWSMKLPVIANAKSEILNHMSNEFVDLPFIQCKKDAQSLSVLLLGLKDDLGARAKYAKIGSQHFDQYHSPGATAKLACEYYHKAIELFWTRKPTKEIEYVTQVTKGLIGRDGMVKVRYVGGNAGTETYDCQDRTKYTFSMKVPVKYIAANHAPYLLSLIDKPGKQRKKVFVRE